MAWHYVGHVSDLYRTYLEYQDNKRMAKRYPENQEYRDRCIVLSDILDMMAYGIACDWAEEDEPISMYTSHLRSLCHHLYHNKVYYDYSTPMYLSHYRDGDKWLYRDGTTKTMIDTVSTPPGYGCPLLADRPTSIFEDW